MESKRMGLGLLTGIAAFTTVGGFVMDWNRTHLFNPAWTPHAKFHDGMTILLGTFLGGSSLYFLQNLNDPAHRNLEATALLPALFYAAQAGAFAFPGAKGMDAEFPEKIPHLGHIKLNEGPFSIAMLAGLGLGYWLAKRR